MDNQQELAEAQRVLIKEANSIISASDCLGENFSQAVDCLYTTRGKIVVSGIGKSGHLGKKLAATFCSTGSPASFLHPSEAVHGDLGIHQEGDPVVFLSNRYRLPVRISLRITLLDGENEAKSPLTCD